MQTLSPRYVTPAETAKLVRRAIASEFPETRFSVRTSTYSGGASIDVRWVDGPRTARVEAIAKRYEGSGFDGMIDLKYNRSHWLRPDGRVFVRHDPGTEGSRGSVPAEDNRHLGDLMPADAEPVHFGADYVFCQRDLSNDQVAVAAAEAWIREHCVIDAHPTDPQYDRFGNRWIGDMARSLAWLREPQETWAEAWEVYNS